MKLNKILNILNEELDAKVKFTEKDIRKICKVEGGVRCDAMGLIKIN